MSPGTGYYAWNKALADAAHETPQAFLAAPVTNSAAVIKSLHLGEYERVKHWERICSSSKVSIT